jgi:hypothetical protein
MRRIASATLLSAACGFAHVTKVSHARDSRAGLGAEAGQGVSGQSDILGSGINASTAAPRASARKTLVVAGSAHALHDGYTDLIYVLLPVWQAEFALGYGMLAVLRGLYAGSMAALQVPAGRLAEWWGGRAVLALGTALAGLGYAIAGLSGGLIGLCVGLVLSGAGSSTQHPIASAAVSRAYGAAARGPLGTYNFTGDLGKAAVPALTALPAHRDAVAPGAVAACQRRDRGGDRNFVADARDACGRAERQPS